MRGKDRSAPEEWLNHLYRAHAEWQSAQRLFAELTEPDEVEWSILNLKACEERYMALWREARREGRWAPVRLR
jgi:hypothetical protein